jgi:hypothetical protein
MTDQSAASNIGPHLLGCHPYHDPRDVRMQLALDDPLQAAFQALLVSTKVALPTKTWAREVMKRIVTDPIPPAPSVTKKFWQILVQLDQGQTPHCVGFSGGDYLGGAPVEDINITDDTGHAIYYECKVRDGQPKVENGSSIHSLAGVLQDRGRLGTYVWARSTDEMTQWLLTKGNVVVGTNWYDAMFYPKASGIVDISGTLAGGHAYVAVGVDTVAGYYEFKNSWSRNWGVNGNFRIMIRDFARLIAEDGEVMAGLELPL